MSEGDVRMQSSSSESSEDEMNNTTNIFPGAEEPLQYSTFTMAPLDSTQSENWLQQQRAELSPPTSQDPILPDPPDFRDAGIGTLDTSGNSGEASKLSINDILQGGESGSASKKDLSVAEREPGASWNNPKHRMEEERVKEQLLDRNFSLRKDLYSHYQRSTTDHVIGEFGDLYNEKDISDEI
ncbi:MAG: hypothetical protein Q9169_002858 [Polycauliona sp. 2 TL-2023]